MGSSTPCIPIVCHERRCKSDDRRLDLPCRTLLLRHGRALSSACRHMGSMTKEPCSGSPAASRRLGVPICLARVYSAHRHTRPYNFRLHFDPRLLCLLSVHLEFFGCCIEARCAHAGSMHGEMCPHIAIWRRERLYGEGRGGSLPVCVLCRPLLRRPDRRRFVLLPRARDVVGERVVRVGRAEQGLDAEQDRADL